MAESVLDEMLALDKAETFKGETTETKTEEKVETTEAKVETTEEKKLETTATTTETTEKKEEAVTPWWKEHEFEDETKAKEFINNAKTANPEVEKAKFASTSVEEYNNWVANGGVEDFRTFQTVKNFSISEKPTPDEMVKALVLQRTMEDPEYLGKEAILEKKIRKDYMLNLLGEDAEYASEEEKEDAELRLIDLNKEFKKTAAHFKTLQEKSTPVVDETLQTRLKEGPGKLKEYLDTQLKEFKITIPELVKGKDDKEAFGDNSIFSINFDESMQKDYRNIYESIAKAKGFPPLDDGSHQEIQATAAALVLGQKLPYWANELYKAGIAAGKSDSIKGEIDAKNPSALVSHETKSTNVNSDDTSGEMFKR